MRIMRIYQLAVFKKIITKLMVDSDLDYLIIFINDC